MSATLKVTREVGFAAIELRRGRFEIAVDGQSVGSLANHETVETAIEPGPHNLVLRSGRYSSRARTFDAADGEVVTYRCHGARIWPTYVASFVKPDLAISLRRE
jgi:aspartate aminotransferase-like enzyme